MKVGDLILIQNGEEQLHAEVMSTYEDYPEPHNKDYAVQIKEPGHRLDGMWQKRREL